MGHSLSVSTLGFLGIFICNHDEINAYLKVETKVVCGKQYHRETQYSSFTNGTIQVRMLHCSASFAKVLSQERLNISFEVNAVVIAIDLNDKQSKPW